MEVGRDDLLSIGAFAELAEVSARMLRHYDGLGLLCPVVTDRNTGYRYYAPGQVKDAWLIRLLRDLDMPLVEIAALLRHPDEGETQMVLEQHRARMQERLRKTGFVLARLNHALAGKHGLMPYEIRLVEVEPQWVLSRRAHTSLAELDPTIVRFVEELSEAARSHGALTDQREIVLYHNVIVRVHGHDIEVCVPLDPRCAAGVPESRQLPGGRAAEVLHRGPWEDARSAYVALFAWILAHGYEPVGPVREVYLVDDRDTDDPDLYVTRITCPIASP